MAGVADRLTEGGEKAVVTKKGQSRLPSWDEIGHRAELTVPQAAAVGLWTLSACLSVCCLAGLP